MNIIIRYIFVILCLSLNSTLAQSYTEVIGEGWDEGIMNSAPILYDIDNDGLVDMFITNGGSYGNYVLHYEQRYKSGYEFQLITRKFNGEGNDHYYWDSVKYLTFSDFDNDTLLNVIIKEDYYDLDHFEQESINSYNFIKEYNYFDKLDIDDENYYNSYFTFADVDNDSLSDFIAGSKNTVHYYEQIKVNSDTFNLVTSNIDSLWFSVFTTPVFAYIDSDSLLDMFIRKNDSVFVFYEQDKIDSTGFSLINTDSLVIKNLSYPRPNLYDIDNDGLLDLLIGDLTGNIQHFEQKYSNSYKFELINKHFLSNTFDMGSSAKPTIADIDGDGLLDLLIGENGSLKHFEQSESGKLQFDFKSEKFNDITDIKNYYLMPKLIDLNKNGLLDLLINYDEKIIRYEQTTTNSISFNLIDDDFIVGLERWGNGFCISDINSDQYLDILAYYSQGFRHYRQSSSDLDSFYLASENFSNIYRNGNSPSITDLDNDNLLDLLIGNGNTLTHFEQESINSFSFKLIRENFNDINIPGNACPTFADINSDGLQDLLIGESGGGVKLFLRNPDGAPVITVSIVDKIKYSSAVLQGKVDPNGYTTSVSFDFGYTNSYGTTLTPVPDAIVGDSPIDIVYNLTNLSANTKYHYRIKAENKFGISYGTDVSFTTIADTLPPVISEIQYSLAEINNDFTVQALVVENLNISNVTLNFRKRGTDNWQSVTMVLDSTIYEGTIESDNVTSQGIEFFVEASDIYGNSVKSQKKEPEIIIPENFIQIQFKGGEKLNSYRMISVPYNLDDPSVKNVLMDDLGDYDRNRWRLYRNENSKMIEFPNCDKFLQGKAFWLINHRDTVITFPSGKTLGDTNKFFMQLRPGWNQVGTPYNFNIDWQDILDASGYPEIAGPYLYEGGYVNPLPDFLEPTKGYYILNKDSMSTNLYFPKKRSNSSSLRKGSPKDGWRLNISAYSKDIKDECNIVGVSSHANELFDNDDLPEPPVVGEYISLYFPHNEWEKYPGNYTIDIQDPLEKGNIWNFEVVTNVEKSELTLEFKGINKSIYDNIPKGYKIVLLDKVLKKITNISDNTLYKIQRIKQNSPRKYSLLVGTDAFINMNSSDLSYLPDRFELFQNYPNPFNPKTTIQFNIPQKTKASLYIYNIAGKKIKTIVNNITIEPGFYFKTWNGKNDRGLQVSSGLYLYIFTTPNFIKTKKMILLR